ncbi:MAG: hypothetical protein DID91_2727704702 [Candidatus Nitrotoga sp. MKT]|nr:MAG: hypothetical protein DID91_2727704702 [Candidatus Nitrotoga sp. MKT]
MSGELFSVGIKKMPSHLGLCKLADVSRIELTVINCV